MLQALSLRKVVKTNWFARLDILLVILGGVAWMFFPEYVGASPLLLLLFPWLLRLIAKEFPFQRTRFDWLILIFLITTWVGYWASYNESSALDKAWLLTTAVFLYYALSSQQEGNLIWVVSGLFALGVGVSLYFFVTHNFIEEPYKVEVLHKIGVWWMNIRPNVLWTPIHPNYVAGVAVLTGIFGFYPLRKSIQSILVRTGILIGFIVILFALIMAASRGIWMAFGAASGVGLVWRLIQLNGVKLRLPKETFFPISVLIFLCLVIAVLYMGPAHSSSGFMALSDYGGGSRAELFNRSLYFVIDYPITGGGLAAFPGLYSEYILDIPYFYFINSHNLFLDVFIEQGIFGGIAFILIYVLCVWLVSRAIARGQSYDIWYFQWLVLIALVIAIIHGMVDDYLYNANGSILSLFLIGLSMILTKEDHSLELVPLRKYGFALLSGLVLLAFVNVNRLRSIWYADFGAVQLAKVELKGFPETGWPDPGMNTHLHQADASLQTALKLDPFNQTANYRLGRIFMLRQDFSSAIPYLKAAYNAEPHHRGIIKSLGFSYAWIGDVEHAVSFLNRIPESKDELDIYRSWWKKQGQYRLFANALKLYRFLNRYSFNYK